MTKDEALKLALEALKWCHGGDPCGTAEAITAIEEVLAQPEQEPVAWLDEEKKIIYWHNTHETDDYHGFKRTTPLYTAPPQRKPLTDEQIMANDVLRYHFALNGGAGPISKKGRKVIDAIEAAHGIKENT